MTSTDTNINHLVINVLSQNQYNELDNPDANEFYLTPDNSLYRSVGEIVTSVLPLTDAAVRLLDGSVLEGTGNYGEFIDYIGYLYDNTEKQPNVSFIGNVTNNNGVLSNFSTSNYANLNTPFKPSTNTWEMVFKFKTPSSWSSANTLFYCGTSIIIQTSSASGSAGHLIFYLTSDSSETSYDIAGTSQSTDNAILNNNYTYWLKFKFTGSAYIAYLSTNGTSYTEYWRVTSSANVKGYNYPHFGLSSSSYVWTGSIDLNNSYINVNGSRWWTGLQPSWAIDNGQFNASVDAYGTCGKFVYNDAHYYNWTSTNISYYTKSATPKVGDHIYSIVDNTVSDIGYTIGIVEALRIQITNGVTSAYLVRNKDGDVNLSTVRLPKISGIVEGTSDVNALGTLVQAGLPNIKGTVKHLMMQTNSDFSYTGAFYNANIGDVSYQPSEQTQHGSNLDNIGLDASKSNSIYGKSTTVQPQTVKVLYYIVVASSHKTNIGVNIDRVVTTMDTMVSDIAEINDQLGNLQYTIDHLDTGGTAYYYNGSTFTKKEIVYVDSLNRDISNPSEHTDAIWLYSTPAYPYVPMTTQTSGTSHTFTNGGVVICTSATTVTVGQGSATLTFTGFVGMLPMQPGAVVTTNITAYFANY